MAEKVTDEAKKVKNKHLRKVMADKGIDPNYVELVQDYAPSFVDGKRVKGRAPNARFYRDRKSGQRIAEFSILPHCTADGQKIECGWYLQNGKYYSKVNLFSAVIEGDKIKVTALSVQPNGAKSGDFVEWNPQLYLNNIEQLHTDPTLLTTDPINAGYHNNTIEWDYGICKRRIRIIEGRIREKWVFASNPNGEVRIKHNHTGTYGLRLLTCKINDDEELIPTSVFDEAEYPFEVRASPETFYPEAGSNGGNTSVDGEVSSGSLDVSWVNLIGAAGGYSDDSSASGVYINIKYWDGGNWNTLNRSIFVIDTSGLPNDATVTGAVFSLYGSAKEDQLGIACDINIYKSTPFSNTALQNDDFVDIGSTPLCASPITYAAFDDGGYNDFTLTDVDTDDFGYISLTSVTKLGARNANYDVSTNEPTNGFSDYNKCLLQGYYADQGNTANDPKLVVTYTQVTLPTVTAQAATNKEDTTATTNGNITNNGGENCDKRGVVYDTSTHADPGNVVPGSSGYANSAEDTDSFGTGAFTKAISGLPTGTTIYYRMYAHNSEGYDYSNTEINFLTKPAAPTSVAATENASDKVVITWVKSTGATDYHVWRDANDLGAAGDVATVDDSGATAPLITAGNAVASDGTIMAHVALSLSGTSVANGTTHTYKVVASNATGNSDDSLTDTGYRLASAITYQWNRSAGDSDASYSTISGATSSTHSDTAAPSSGAGRYFTCTLVSTNASNTPATATANRGYRKSAIAQPASIAAKLMSKGML